MVSSRGISDFGHLADRGFRRLMRSSSSPIGRRRGRPGWATLLIARQVRKNIAADLERLRSCLEG
jgi:hypothetical protein